MMRICVFCGSSAGNGERYLEVATELGKTLAAKEIGLVYGGASIGTMGAVADGALAGRGEVIGVIPDHLVSVEISHPGLSELQQVPDMHTRKARMAELSDGFMVLPGGIGTLEEFFEVWTWGQLRLHEKPIGLVDVDGFYTHLLRFADHMVEQGFLRQKHRDMLLVDPDPAVLVDKFTDYAPPEGKFA
nr:TIGR00730 family Rossman fold protein [Sciscionella marina]